MRGNQMSHIFKEKGYAVIKNILDKQEVERLYQYTLKNAELGNKDDGQVPGSPSFYQDKEVVRLQKQLLPKIEEHIQMQLLPVFCYNRVYRTGAVLRVHKDSERAEISTTLNVGNQGEIWDLWLLDYDENAQRIALAPGDALVYYGSKLSHWRSKLVHADYVSQIMFHCVDKHGKHTMAAKTEVIRKIRKSFRQMLGVAW